MMDQKFEQEYPKIPQPLACSATSPCAQPQQMLGNLSGPLSSSVEQAFKQRRDSAERDRVLAFYDTVLTNINHELEDEVKPEDNVAINGLIDQLVEDLKRKNKYDELEEMSEKHKRTELLLALHERVYARRNKIAQRESFLDDLEKSTLPPSLFDISVEMQDRIELPAAMWEQAINKIPNKRHMDLMFENYPKVLIEKFLDLLSNEKEEIALRMQKRHENIVSQMRKELRKEAEKEKIKADEAEKQFGKVQTVLDAIKTAYKKQQDDRKALNKNKKRDLDDQAQLYSQLMTTLYDTQLSVEEEAERGRLLKDQINSVNAQTELLHQVNDDTIKKVEATNIALMKNIKRLRNSVKQNETRLLQLQSMSSGHLTKKSSHYFIA